MDGETHEAKKLPVQASGKLICKGSSPDPIALDQPFISYAQNFEDVMLWRALRQLETGFYIDVGAHAPIADSVTAAFYERGWTGINIEPVAECYDRLVVARSRDINLKLCVGALPGKVKFYVIPKTGLSTLSSAIAAEHQSRGFDVLEGHVDVLPLAEICRRHITGPINFLKIDAEGAEGAVLAGADFKFFRPWIVLVEATAPMSQIETYLEWEHILLEAEYAYVWFDGLNRFYVANEQMAMLDFAFHAPPNVFDCFKLHRDHNFTLPPLPTTTKVSEVTIGKGSKHLSRTKHGKTKQALEP